jgi:hypothetical protein
MMATTLLAGRHIKITHTLAGTESGGLHKKRLLREENLLFHFLDQRVIRRHVTPL